MARSWTIQTDFSGGELSPRMYARTDLPYYRKAVKTMTNMYPQIHGGATSRKGTVFVDEVNDSSRDTRIISFITSRSLAFVLVFNGGVIEFVSTGVFLTEGSPETRVSISHPYADDELATLKYVQIGSALIITHQNHRPQQVLRISGGWSITEFPITSNAVSDFTFNSAFVRFKIIEGADEFGPGDIFTIDTSVDPALLTYTPNPNPVGSPLPTGGDGTLAAVFIKELSPPNEFYEIVALAKDDNDNMNWSVTGFTQIGSPVGLGSPRIEGTGLHTVSWFTEVGSPEFTNYPGAVSLYQQRLWFAGSILDPQSIWGSAIADFSNFTLGAEDHDSVEFIAASNTFDDIIHLESARSLLPLSFAVEFALTSGGGGAITASSRNLTAQTYHGTSDVKPIRIGQEIIFVQRGGLKVRSINYSLVEDRNTAPDMTILAEHITGTGLVDSTFAQDPDYIAWFVREDGQIASFTLERDYDVTAWATHVTDGAFLGLATIPNVTIDQTYIVVERTTTVGSPEVPTIHKYIEYFDYIEFANTDSALFGTIEGGSPELPTDTWTGLDHLEGKEVAVVADGSIHPNVTVTNGTIVLQRNVSSLEVGLPFTATLELLHPDIPSLSSGTSQGRNLNISEFYVRVQNTIGLSINGVVQTNRKLGDSMDSPVNPLSGDFSHYDFIWEKDNNILIEQTTPTPLFVIGAILEVTVND